MLRRTPQEEEIKIYNEILRSICEDYIVLADTKIDVIPKDLFEFINLILDTMEENPYSNSFINSLIFIYKTYLGCLNVGAPDLFGETDEGEDSYLEITLDSNQQLYRFTTFDMSLLEESKIMTKMVLMAIKKQLESMLNPDEYKPSKVIIKEL